MVASGSSPFNLRVGIKAQLSHCHLRVLQDLLRYGDYLRKRGQVPQAHVAYLIAGLQLGTNEAWDRDFFLVGVDHNEARDASSFE